MNGAWFVDFGTWSIWGKGSVVSHYKTNSFYVLPARGTTSGPAQVWRTGQTTSYATGDDGDIEAGVQWPIQRYIDNGDGTMKDNLTGLVWLKDANCIKTNYSAFDNDGTIRDGLVTWQHALNFITGINNGTYLNCGAGHNDWRLPNRKEIYSLLDFSHYNPALPYGHLFNNSQAGGYWSSTTSASNTGRAWFVDFLGGGIGDNGKTSNYYVLPVRGGHRNIFLDVPSGYWAEDFIIAIYNAEITSGCGNGNYCPEASVTRSQMAVFMIKSMIAAGLLPSNFTYSAIPYFTDVPSNHWAFKYIQKMKELNITGGCTTTTYCPNDNVTRAQMAVFITRALDELPATTCTGTVFNDVNTLTVGDGFCRYIEKFSTLGITSGCQADNPSTPENEAMYCPFNDVSRAQMAVFLTKGFLQ